MIKKIFRVFVAMPLILVMIAIVWFNVGIGYEPEVMIDGRDTIQYELVRELRGLGKALDKNADLRMQHMYPEGYVFFNALYALTWSSFLSHDAHKKYLEEGRAEIKKAWNKINSDVGKAPFSEHLPLPYGAFYNGWNAYVLGSKLRLEHVNIKDKNEIDLFKQQCDRIAKALKQTTYPLSYHGAAWPADAMICVASLKLHDQIFDPHYTDVIEKWLAEVKGKLDHQGMIPHSVHPLSGVVRENARGSSMTLMLTFLHDVDISFAQEQFVLFKEKFVDTKFGLTGIREYSKGATGSGDIDSGPVIFGFGGSATIVGMQTLSLFGENESSLRIRNLVEVLAFPLECEHHKEYFFGHLPIADAFIAWSHSSIRYSGLTPSFTKFRFASFLLFAMLSTLVWSLISSRKVLRQ